MSFSPRLEQLLQDPDTGYRPPRFSVPEERLTGRPSIQLEEFTSEEDLAVFVKAFDWYIEWVRAFVAGRG